MHSVTGVGIPRWSRRFRLLVFLVPATTVLAACPVTKAPDPPFVPPRPYRANPGTGGFLYGTPALWAIVFPHWRVHGPGGSKLPYFRQGYDSRNERNPDLTVVARRLDGTEQTVNAGPANSASFNGTVERMFMVTGLDIPVAGCWEIAARYAAAPDKIQTLSYTVWVEP